MKWTKEEEDYLINNYSNKALDYLHFENYLSRSKRSISQKVIKLGIIRRKLNDKDLLERNIKLALNGLKECNTCNELLPLNCYTNSPINRDGLTHFCKICYNKYRKNKRDNVPITEEKKRYYAERARKYRENKNEQYRNAIYKRKYSLTIKEYNSILENQNHCCGICGIHESIFKKHLYVDHCHTTNKVRGLLCRTCNLAIAYLKDNTEVVKNTLSYLEKYKNVN